MPEKLIDAEPLDEKGGTATAIGGHHYRVSSWSKDRPGLPGEGVARG